MRLQRSALCPKEEIGLLTTTTDFPVSFKTLKRRLKLLGEPEVPAGSIVFSSMQHCLCDGGQQRGQQAEEFVYNNWDCGTGETVCDSINETDVPGYGISDD